MIARHDLVLGRTPCHCFYLLTILPHLFTLCIFFILSQSHFPFALNLSTFFFVIYSLSSSIYCHGVTFISLVCLFSAFLVLAFFFSLMYAFFISRFVSFAQPIIIFLYSHPLPSLSRSLPLCSSPLHVVIPLSQHHVCHRGKHREQWSLLNNYHAKQFK